MAKIKICGITNTEDAGLAIENGADYIGLIFAPSQRRIIKGQAKMIADAFPDFKNWVGVFMNGKKRLIEETLEGLPIKILQFHGEETPAFCNYFINRGYQVIKAIGVENRRFALDPSSYEKASHILFDTSIAGKAGGTGISFDWATLQADTIHSLGDRLILSGGLTPDNVKEAIENVRPSVVDVSSGIEKEPGKKDATLLKEFIQSANEKR